MIDKFINRKNEMKVLEERFNSDKPEFIVIYGRRRVGKTELIKNFSKNKPHVYFLSDRRSDREQLNEISRKIGEFFNDGFLVNRGFENWIQMFEYLKNKIEKRIVITLDEFPFLIMSNKSIPSIFQKGWDEYLKDKNILLILCGSSMGMMERGVLSYKSPLYGRRTGQLLINPLNFFDSKEFFPKYDKEEKIKAFSILGGVPAYLKQFDDSYSIEENIRRKILSKDSFLFNEPEFLLKEELKEPRMYFSILKAISFGNMKLGEIANALGIERNKVSMYLSVLESLKLVERFVPITEKHPHKSRKGMYFLKDNFLKFWLRFVYPYKAELEMDELEIVLNNKIKPFLDQHVSFIFEDICKDFLIELNKKQRLPFNFEKIGKWWYKDKEIDLVALKEKPKQVLFCEIKWSKLKKNYVMDLAKNLKEKSKSVEWFNKERKEYFGIVAKKIENKDKIEEKDFFVFDIDDF